MENKKLGKTPIINISSSNLSTGKFGEYLLFLDYSEPVSEIKYDSEKFSESKIQNVITQTFKSNQMIGEIDNINTNLYSVPTKEFIENEIKYITSIPIIKELVLPIPEQFGVQNPTKLKIIKNFDYWFLNNVFYQNSSIKMKKDNVLNALDNPDGIKNKINFNILFNTDVTFKNIVNEKETFFTKTLFFGFKFSTEFITSFICTFEYLQKDLITFLLSNLELIKNLDCTKNGILLSENISETTIIDSLSLNEFKIINNKETYINLKNYRDSKKIYKCTLKLIPQDYINNIDYENNTYDIQNNLNNFYQTFSNENTFLFDKIFNDTILNTFVNKTEDINIININTGINYLCDEFDPDLENLKKFIKLKLINFIENLDIFPFSTSETSTNTGTKRDLSTIPSEISYNIIRDSALIEIGKRQIILKFNNKLILNDSGIYSDIYILQYNINEGRLELIPVINKEDYSLFKSDEIINSTLYSKSNTDKSFKLFKTISNNIPENILINSEYNNFIIYNNTEGLGTRLKIDQKKETIKETNKYRLKIIKNYNLTQTQINSLLETMEENAGSGLVYSSYGLSTIYIS